MGPEMYSHLFPPGIQSHIGHGPRRPVSELVGDALDIVFERVLRDRMDIKTGISTHELTFVSVHPIATAIVRKAVYVSMQYPHLPLCPGFC